MAKQVLQILLGFILVLLLQQCAQIAPLNGGKKDITPPKLVEAIPAGKSTGFNTDRIVLRFDEYVQVKDLSNQLIVSPKLKTAPEITADGRSVNIVLEKDELQPNTTYRFYFGNAIADMNESNSIPDFEYVFSTGTFIDSLKVKGVVTDAFTNKTAGGVLVGLYNATTATDSTPYKDAPDYIAKTSDAGEFSFRNLPRRTFKVVAFSDKNKNSMYDGEIEKIAFLDSGLVLGSDTSIALKLFQEDPSKGFIKKTNSPYYGFSQFILNKKAKVKLLPINNTFAYDIAETSVGKEKDTVSFYYRNIKDTMEFVVQNITFKKNDTIKVVAPKKSSSKKRLKSYSTNISSGSLALGNQVRLTFLNWMDTTKIDLSKFKLTDKSDSLATPVPVKGRWTSITDFEITTKLKEGVSYTLKIDTLALLDVNGSPNDTLKADFKTQSKLEFGKVTLKLLLNKKQSYVIQLIDGNDKVIREQFVSFSLSSSNAVTLDFTDVAPGTYVTKIIFDDNENKKWDSGSLLRKKQPERVIINSKQLKVLSDWEIEEEILIKE